MSLCRLPLLRFLRPTFFDPFPVRIETLQKGLAMVFL